MSSSLTGAAHLAMLLAGCHNARPPADDTDCDDGDGLPDIFVGACLEATGRAYRDPSAKAGGSAGSGV